MKKSKLDDTYRARVSPNSLRRSGFELFGLLGAAWRIYTGGQDIKDGFAEENRRHKKRKANMIRNIFG